MAGPTWAGLRAPSSAKAGCRWATTPSMRRMQSQPQRARHLCAAAQLLRHAHGAGRHLRNTLGVHAEGDTEQRLREPEHELWFGAAFAAQAVGQPGVDPNDCVDKAANIFYNVPIEWTTNLDCSFTTKGTNVKGLKCFSVDCPDAYQHPTDDKQVACSADLARARSYGE